MDLRQALIPFFAKFAHLYDAGVPLAEALEIVRREMPPPLAEAIGELVDDIYRGTSLADAMERRAEIFGPEIVGLIRAGETRGALSEAARSAADGLRGRVLDATPASGVDLDALLDGAGDARALHLDADGRLRLRIGRKLVDGGTAPTAALAAQLAQQPGAFLWKDRLVRVGVAPTPEGPTVVLRLSGAPKDEPPEAAKWRKGSPALLLVLGGRHQDTDTCLRSILKAFDEATTKRVAVDLPVPEATPVGSIEEAMAHDPDVLCVARVRRPADAERLWEAVESGTHVVAAAASARLFEDVPYVSIRV